MTTYPIHLAITKFQLCTAPSHGFCPWDIFFLAKATHTAITMYFPPCGLRILAASSPDWSQMETGSQPLTADSHPFQLKPF